MPALGTTRNFFFFNLPSSVIILQLQNKSFPACLAFPWFNFDLQICLQYSIDFCAFIAHAFVFIFATNINACGMKTYLIRKGYTSFEVLDVWFVSSFLSNFYKLLNSMVTFNIFFGPSTFMLQNLRHVCELLVKHDANSWSL